MQKDGFHVKCVQNLTLRHTRSMKQRNWHKSVQREIYTVFILLWSTSQWTVNVSGILYKDSYKYSEMDNVYVKIIKGEETNILSKVY